MNRRDFIKKSTIATGAVAGASLLKPMPSFASTKRSILSKEHNSIDNVMNISKDYKRFDQKNTCFNIGLWSVPNPLTKSFAEAGEVEKWKYLDFPTDQDSDDPYVLKNLPGAFVKLLAKEALMPPEVRQQPGFTQLDLAFSNGGAILEKLTGSIFARVASGDSGPFATALMPNGQHMRMPMTLWKTNFPGTDFMVRPNKWKFDSLEDASYAVKKVAKKYGASLVGIAPYDERFTYNSEVFMPVDMTTNQIDPATFNIERPVDLGFEPKTVIVLAHEIDYETNKLTPAIGNAAHDIEYSRMLEISIKVAAFVRNLGFNAIHAGNGIGLSVPLAISAGLGESSRMGLLITEEFGPRVRISKIYTDMEIKTDKPITFGVKKFCEVCMKCADNCPSGAITRVVKTIDSKPYTRSNNPGVDKWYNNLQKCLAFWGENWSGCANCMTACPYNKIDAWHHDVAEIATKLPLLRNVAKYLDEIFGYGLVGNEEYMVNFWKKSI